MSDPDCLFCKIASGEIPADVVHESERVVAFRDVSPQAPVHVLVIPRSHIASLAEAEAQHGDLLGELMLVASRIAHREGIAEAGFRSVVNSGAEGGQVVPHLHVHVLGGRALGWPPG